jgi:hypothetical protein
MANSTPQVFTGITPSQYALLGEKAREAGIDVSGKSGRTKKMGVEVEWNYCEEKQELVLTCLQTPFFLSTENVNAKLRSLVNETLTA